MYRAQARAAAEMLRRPKWVPNPGPQSDFLACDAFEALYGGSAGGGKTWALVHDALRFIDRPTYNALLLRNTFPELEKTLLEESRRVYPKLGATYRDDKKVWRFPSGAKVYLGYLDAENDVYQYQGAEFQFVGFDELTTFSLRVYTYLISRLRSAHGVPSRIRATTNPGGKGHGWVLARWAPWVDKCAPRKASPGEVLHVRTGPDGERYDDDAPLTRTFIPAKLSDNPKLTEADPDYITRLELLDPVTLAQLRDGRWDIQPAAGLYFRRDWFTFVDAVPDKAVRVRYWDKAATEPSSTNPDPDWTAGVKLAKAGGVYYIENVARMRGNPGAVEAYIRATAELDGKPVAIRTSQDPGSAGKSEAAAYVRLLDGYDIRTERETGDKVTRVAPVSAQASPQSTGGAKGRFCIVRGAWNDTFLAELEAFPDGDHDDQADALSGAFRGLVGVYDGPPRLAPPPTVKTYDSTPLGFG